MALDDTIAAIASPPGRSPRAILRVSGPHTRSLLGSILSLPDRADEPPQTRCAFAARLKLPSQSGAALSLPVLVLRFVAPKSYTGEDGAEILLPGNPLLAQRVLDLIVSHDGVRRAGPGEFSARAYLNNRLTLDEAEGVSLLIAAATDEERAAAAKWMKGEAGDTCRRWGDELTELLALVEAGIDFTDQEDVVAIEPAELASRAGALASEIQAALGPASAATQTTEPKVALVGAPSAGKSTLFNALLGRRRAVTHEDPGTTRDVLAEPLPLDESDPDAPRILLLDLPGLDADPDSPSARAAQASARAALDDADLLLWCDPTARFQTPPAAGRPTIRVRTKADMPVAPSIGAPSPSAPPPDLELSAFDPAGIASLKALIAGRCERAPGSGDLAVSRHHRRTLAAAAGLLSGLASEGPGADPSVAAERLRTALDHLGELLGRIPPDEVIGRVFARFCVGK
ncbi:MAG: 50S ribosome-binding GTPase [Phycisphaerales bacterium]|nr:50S ribosome-binding GTPase [Phycisphaerales bacterium]